MDTLLQISVERTKYDVDEKKKQFLLQISVIVVKQINKQVYLFEIK